MGHRVIFFFGLTAVGGRRSILKERNLLPQKRKKAPQWKIILRAKQRRKLFSRY
jgi:hypothetical protein